MRSRDPRFPLLRRRVAHVQRGYSALSALANDRCRGDHSEPGRGSLPAPSYNCRPTSRCSRRAAVRWPWAEAPRASWVHVSGWSAGEGRERLSERTLGGSRGITNALPHGIATSAPRSCTRVRRMLNFVIVTKTRLAKVPRKVTLQRATASEIISALGIDRSEERRAKAAVATAERIIRRRSTSAKKRVSAKIQRLRKSDDAK